MKKLVMLAIAFAMFGTWVAQAAAETTLRFNQWIPTKHFAVTKGHVPWAEKVAKVTDGRVKIQFTTKSLGAPPRQFDLAVTGVADVVWGVTGYTAGRFVSAEISELPFSGKSGEALSVALWRTHQKFFAKANEYKGVKLLSLHNHSPGQISTNNKEITKLEDLKNVKIRVPNFVTSEILKYYKGVPFRGPAPKSYEFYSKGIIDGSFMTNDGILSFKLAKFAKYFIEVPNGLYNSTFFVAMNQAKWDAISSVDKKAIEGVSGESFARVIGGAWDAVDQKGRELVRSGGTKVTTIQGAELAKLKSNLSFIKNNWLKKVAAKGIDGAGALKYLRAQAAAY